MVSAGAKVYYVQNLNCQGLFESSSAISNYFHDFYNTASIGYTYLFSIFALAFMLYTINQGKQGIISPALHWHGWSWYLCLTRMLPAFTTCRVLDPERLDSLSLPLRELHAFLCANNCRSFEHHQHLLV